MTHFSLPQYRSLQSFALGARWQQPKPWLTRRELQVLRDLAVLLTIFVLLQEYVLALTSALERPIVPERPGLVDFERVQRNFHSIRHPASREEVEQLLGPPATLVWQPRFADVEERLKVGAPTRRIWEMWTDPREPSKSVTILFADGYVRYIEKKGF